MRLGDRADEDHRRDYAAKERFDVVRRGIADIAADDDAWKRLPAPARKDVMAAMKLNDASAHIVAVWD